MRSIGIAIGLFVALCGFDRISGSRDHAWVHSVERGAGPARILRFYATAGAVAPGQQVELCYSVENARSVRISPLLTGTYPARNYCLAVAPEHTTHFTLMAEGYDGTVAARSVTLAVEKTTRPSPAVNDLQSL